MFGNPYQYSGLGRFASVGEFNPSAYVPHIYRPSLLNVPTAAPYQPPVLNTGLLGSDPYGGGGGTGPGTPGGLGATADTPSTPGSVTPGQGMAVGTTIGGPVGGLLGGLIGFASQAQGTTPIGVAAAQDDGTTAGIQATIDGMNSGMTGSSENGGIGGGVGDSGPGGSGTAGPGSTGGGVSTGNGSANDGSGNGSGVGGGK